MPAGQMQIPQRENLEGIMRDALHLELDRLQIVLGGRWRRLLWYISCTASAALAGGVLIGSDVHLVAAVELAAIAFFVGGFFATLSRDVVAGVERWRR